MTLTSCCTLFLFIWLYVNWFCESYAKCENLCCSFEHRPSWTELIFKSFFPVWESTLQLQIFMTAFLYSCEDCLLSLLFPVQHSRYIMCSYMKHDQWLTMMWHWSCFTASVQVYLLHFSTYKIWWDSCIDESSKSSLDEHTSLQYPRPAFHTEITHNPPEVIPTPTCKSQPTRSRKEHFWKGRDWLQC